jgi:hypothetical protein
MLDRELYAPVAAAVFCAPVGVDWSMISGRAVVSKGQLKTLVVPLVIEHHSRIARAELSKEPLPAHR